MSSKMQKRQQIQRKEPKKKARSNAPTTGGREAARLTIRDGRSTNTGRPSLSQARGLSPYFRDLARQFLTPINATQTLAITPSSYPALVCARHFHKVFDVSSVAYPNGFKAAMFPDLFAPGYISNTASVLVPPAGGGPVAIAGKATWDGTGLVCSSSRFELYDNSGDATVMQLVPIVDAALVTRYGFVLVPGIASAFNMDLTNTTRQVKVVPRFYISYKLAAGAWTMIAQPVLAESANYVAALTVPANAVAVAFHVLENSAHPTDWTMKMSLSNGQVQTQAADSLGPGFPRFIIDNNIQYGRVVSMSMLVTNTSPALTKGGSINAARVPNTFDPFKDIPGQIADLPQNRRHQGDAEFGAYVNWMPTQFDEFEVDNVDQKRQALRDAEFIYVALDAWPAGSSVKIQCDWIVEFNTPNQVYEKVMTPPTSDSFHQLYYHLLTMPAAMCNPSHDSLFKSLVHGGVQRFKDGAAFYEHHKDTIHSIADVLSSLAAAV